MIGRRERFRKGLSALYLPFYDALCEELGDGWQPTCGYRSFEDQQKLFESNLHLTNAKAGQSPHNYGCATDWAPVKDGAFFWPKTESEWDPYFQAIEKLGLKGLKNLGDFPHNELLLSCSWAHILDAYNKGGLDAAESLIRASLVR